MPKCQNFKTADNIQEGLLHVCLFIQMPITAGFDNTQSSPVSEERRWAVGGFRLRVRSSSLCGTVHGRRFLAHTHTRCSPCPFYFSGFPNVPVCAPARLWGVEWEVTRGEWRHWKQPSTPSDNLSSHCVSVKPQLKLKIYPENRSMLAGSYAGPLKKENHACQFSLL